MARWYEAANEASFKQVPEGYVFQSPNPWIFARPRYYLVNGAQKAEIGALLGRWRLLSLTCLAIVLVLMASLVAFVTLSPAVFVRLAAPALQLGIGAFALMLTLVLILVLGPLVIGPQIYLTRALRQPLADAPRTNERITMRDQLPKIAAAVSSKVLVLGLVGGVALMGSVVLKFLDAYLEGHLTPGVLALFSPLFILGGALTAYFVYLVRLRAKPVQVPA